MEPPLNVPLPTANFTKRFEMDYYKINEGLWRAKSRVEDPIYKVIVTLDMSVPDFLVVDSSAQMFRYPHRGCEKAADKIKVLKGADLRGPFRDLLRREYQGPKGCETIFNLVNLSGRTFVMAYLGQQRAIGNITHEQFSSWSGGMNCVAALDGGHGHFSEEDVVPVVKPPEDVSKSTGPPCGESEPVFGRILVVEYFDLSEELWRARARVEDSGHHLIVSLDVSTADLTVQDTDVTFLRQPFTACGSLQHQIKKMNAACLAVDFRQKAAQHFVGMQGCGNIYVMLSAIYHGFLQFYLWRNTAMGRITPEQAALCKKGLQENCIACGL